ncbi:MAG: hypothetical protein GY847_22415 [Proteobacteria bacterium]|nr:hypothetical protein [Pseudomonadota bacterium]
METTNTKPITCIAIILGLGLSFTSAAEANTKRELTYRYNQIWNTAVRFLRVDNAFPVLEKDKKAGYILFEYRDRGRSLQSSLEIVRTVSEKKHVVRTRLRIASMPSYVEVVLLDKLLRKLKSEYGSPPPAERVVTYKDKSGKSNGKAGGGSSNSTTKEEPPEDEEDIEVEEEDLDEIEEK